MNAVIEGLESMLIWVRERQHLYCRTVGELGSIGLGAVSSGYSGAIMRYEAYGLGHFSQTHGQSCQSGSRTRSAGGSGSVAAISMLFLSLLALVGCSRTKSARESSVSVAGSEFSAVAERLEREAKAGSVEGTTIEIKDLGEEHDGRRVVSAIRTLGSGTTDYRLEFRRQADRWVCCDAVAKEQETGGGVTEHRLGGDMVDIEQLVIWLGWHTEGGRNKGS